MKEISLHILDLVQNSINAGANLIQIIIAEDMELNQLTIKIADNGRGMDQETLKLISDPFFTTAMKKTGLGIPLLKQHAEAAGGTLVVETEKGKGTTVNAMFQHNHIDRQPMGDITSTITGLIRAFPDIDFVYRHTFNNNHFTLDTREIKTELQEISINSMEIISFLTDMINENLIEIRN